MVGELDEGAGGDDLHLGTGPGGFGAAGGRADEAFATGVGADGGRQYARDRRDRAVEAKLAQHRKAAERVRRDRSDGRHQAERDRQVVVAAFLRQVGGGEIDGDTARRQRQPGRDQRRPHSLARFGHGLVGQTDHVDRIWTMTNNYCNRERPRSVRVNDEKHAVIPAKPKAYSYIRFSTPRQREGHSLERQTVKAAEYAAEHGLELDTELNLKDLGVSGYRKKNARTGALGLFFNAVNEGRVPRNSYLLVENIDRLTRADIPDAMTLFLSLITSGIVVVTLTNRQAFSRDSLIKDPNTIFFIVLELIRANQESARKGALIAAAREKKRQDLWKGVPKPYSRQCPAWLKWSEEACKFVVLEERAAIVRAIYEKADQGWSHDRIARWLNTQRTPTWGGGKRQATHWRGSYILKITKSAAAIGTFIPRRTEHDELTGARRDVPLDPAHNYYPSVVDRDLFERVRARTSVTAPRGRNAGRVTTSIFAGLIKCAHCSGTVTRLSEVVPISETGA